MGLTMSYLLPWRYTDLDIGITQTTVAERRLPNSPFIQIATFTRVRSIARRVFMATLSSSCDKTWTA
jgi:hypothetical protein